MVDVARAEPQPGWSEWGSRQWARPQRRRGRPHQRDRHARAEQRRQLLARAPTAPRPSPPTAGRSWRVLVIDMRLQILQRGAQARDRLLFAQHQARARRHLALDLFQHLALSAVKINQHIAQHDQVEAPARRRRSSRLWQLNAHGA